MEMKCSTPPKSPSMEPIKLFGSWACSHTHRVQLALKLKGLEFEYVEEDPLEKVSSHYPSYAKPPVLLHGCNPIVDSTVILEYIDEVWPENLIVPEEPFERAMVRFWCRFTDSKMGPAVATTFQTIGEEQRSAVTEVHEHLSLIERELREGLFEGRRFFGGERVGLLDIVIGCGSYWLPVFEEVAEVKLVDPCDFPLFSGWLRGFEEESMVKETIPAHEKLLEYARGLRGMILGLNLSNNENDGKVVKGVEASPVTDVIVSRDGGN